MTCSMWLPQPLQVYLRQRGQMTGLHMDLVSFKSLGSIPLGVLRRKTEPAADWPARIRACRLKMCLLEMSITRPTVQVGCEPLCWDRMMGWSRPLP